MVTIVIKKLSPLADSLTNHPDMIEFKVNQVSFTCELVTALLVYWQLICVSVQCVIWDVDAVLHTRVHIYPALCVYVCLTCVHP